MKSRAELLAELEEKRIENNKKKLDIDELSIVEPGAPRGYDPYDNPSVGKELPDSAALAARWRRAAPGNRRR